MPGRTAKVCACPNNKRHYVPHKRELMVLVCACGRQKRTTKRVPHYNMKRRQLRFAEDLETISVPLNSSSAKLIQCARTHTSLENNTAIVHVTLVEGMRAPLPDALVQALSAALARAPGFTVRDANLVTCKRDKNRALVIFELEPPPAVAERVRALAMHSGCILLQWPLQVALGVAPMVHAALAARVLLETHGGTVLSVNAHRLEVLPLSTALVNLN